MDTDGGGWTVLWATSGSDDDLPFRSNINLTVGTGSPLDNHAYNLDMATKLALSSLDPGMSTLFRRSATAFIVADHAPLPSAAASSVAAGGIWGWPVVMRAPAGGDGSVSSRGWLQFSSSSTAGGGDLSLSYARVAVGTATTAADLVAIGCAQQLVYSFTATVEDGDGAYGSAAMLGNWDAEGVCTGAETGGIGMMVAVREPLAVARRDQSCLDVRNRDPSAPSGFYTLYPAGLEGGHVVYCDMDTARGGWGVIYSSSGSDGDIAFTSDTTADGDPAAGEVWNTRRAVKEALTSGGAGLEVLFLRGSSEYLTVACPLATGESLFGGLASPTVLEHVAAGCTATSSDGSTAEVVLAWSTSTSSAGGDIAVLRADTATTFDRHMGSTAPLLNADCAGHLLYTSSPSTPDGDARFGSAVSLGDWSATTPGACLSGATEAGGMALRIGVRQGPVGVWVPLAEAVKLVGSDHSGADAEPTLVSVPTPVSAVKFRHRDGRFSCDAAHAQSGSDYVWDACASGYGGAHEGFSLDVALGSDHLFVSSTARQLPEGCSVPTASPASGDITCDSPAGDTVVVVPGQEFALRSLATGGSGVAAVDVSGFVPHAAAVPRQVVGSYPRLVESRTWVRLGEDVEIRGATNGTTFSVDMTMHVHGLRLEHKSGYVTCNHLNASTSESWGSCFPTNETAEGTPLVFFELVKNQAELLYAMSDELHIAEGCVGPSASQPLGPVHCTADFGLVPADSLQLTWVDPRTQASIYDNAGTHVVDVWGYVSVPHTTPSTSFDPQDLSLRNTWKAGTSSVLDVPVTSDTVVEVVCEDGLTNLGSATRTLTDDGTWSGSDARCLGTLRRCCWMGMWTCSFFAVPAWLWPLAGVL